MKKVFFGIVALAAISFASCGGAQQKAEEACDSTQCCVDSAAAVVEEVVDSAAAVVDSAAAVVTEVEPQ